MNLDRRTTFIIATAIGIAFGATTVFLEKAAIAGPTPSPAVSARIFVVKFPVHDPITQSDGSLKFDLTEPGEAETNNPCKPNGGFVIIGNGTVKYDIKKGANATGSFKVEVELLNDPGSLAGGSADHYPAVEVELKSPDPSQDYTGEATGKPPIPIGTTGVIIKETCSTPPAA